MSAPEGKILALPRQVAPGSPEGLIKVLEKAIDQIRDGKAHGLVLFLVNKPEGAILSFEHCIRGCLSESELVWMAERFKFELMRDDEG